MRKFWLVIPLVLVAAVWLYGCDQTQNPLEAATAEDSEEALFAAGGKVKASPNPTNCTQDQVAKWDETTGAWVCAADLQGSTGPQPALLSGYEVVHVTEGGTHSAVAEALCPAGKVLITGGYYFNGSPATEVTILGSHPHPEESGWKATAYNGGDPGTIILSVYAACVDAMPAS